MTTACDFAWGHLNPVHEIPSVTAEATAEGWRAVFRDRDALSHLLLSQPTVFVFPEDERAKDYILGFITKALQQTTDQRNASAVWNRWGTITQQARGSAFVKSFTGEPLPVHAAKRPEQANKIVYLCAKGWDYLNPLQRARGVLEATRYVEWIRSSAPGRPGNSAAAPIELSIGHQHLPSLTVRQSRRSTVSQQELRSRWA
ncbi:hypothetical protein BCR35DRAFT_334431 [Leucosporidium creatinivorum]|uniref:Uncharacterized protein n=1 Tax=Leucosporidium creatinivorum TaxID=106004 RepID=A0A1Y2E9I2_9BASI|nr:hypothetical protein BCR35DRAFT_334431 [Leucosporidium creatinivorum]